MTIPEDWKLYAYGSLAAAVFGVIGWLAIARANLKAELAQERANYTMCRSVNDDWANYASGIDAAVRKLQADIAERQALAAEALSRAEREAEKHAAEARAIMSAKRPGDECRASRQLLQDYLRRRS